MRLSEKKVLLIIIGLALILAIVFAGMNIFVFRINLAKVRQEIADKDIQIKQAQEQKQQMEQLKNEVDKLKKEMDSFEKTLPAKDKIASYEIFIDTLDNICKEANIALKNARLIKEGQRSVSPNSQSSSTSYEKISYDLLTEGEFFDLIKFISLLEEYPRFIKINSFSLAPQDMNQVMQTGKSKHSMSIRITTYVYNSSK